MIFHHSIMLVVFGVCLLIFVAQTSAADVDTAMRVKREYGGHHDEGHSHGGTSSEEDNGIEDCEAKIKKECANMDCMTGKFCTGNRFDCTHYNWNVYCRRCPTTRNCKKAVCTNSYDSECVKCRRGFYINGTSKTCQACSHIANCYKTSCDGPNNSTCAKCECGYTQSEDKTKCVSCKRIEHCLWISCADTKSSTCYMCDEGYRPNENLTACLECPSRKPIENCEKRVIRSCFKSFCKRCKDGYFVERGKCQVCPSQQNIENCEEKELIDCHQNRCNKCKSGYFLQGDKCIACSSQSSIQHCNIQVATDCNHSICKECENGYFPDGDTCKVCPSEKQIDNCLESVKINCKKRICRRCADGYYINGDLCTACPVHSPIPHCRDDKVTCFERKCTRCMDGYTLVGNMCTECADQSPIEHCVEISKGPNCADAKCTKCSDGYYLDSNKCLECPSRKPIQNCNTQQQANCSTSVCLQCAEGYYWNQWNGQVCTMCNPITNCLRVSCSNSLESRCDECKDTYKYDSSVGQCVVCPSQFNITNCQETKIIDCEQNTCQKCNKGFFYESNICKECPSKTKILYCEEQDILDCFTSKCRRCRIGYYSNGNTCKECNAIDKCTDTRCSTENDQICMSCDNTFRPSSDKRSCEGCPSQMSISNCQTKQVIDCSLSVCSHCEDGYFPFSNTCKECPSRSQSINNCEEKQILDCNSSTCKKCKTGFFAENNKCTACNAIENCLNVTCTNKDTGKCTLCRKSYTYDLNSNKCVDCPSQKPIAYCRIQSTINCESSRCELCHDGFYSIGSSCEDCLQVPNCLSVTCESGNYSKCTSCDDGFKLTIDGKCEVCPSSIPINRCRRQVDFSCDLAICEQCDHGYYFDGKSCIKCMAIPDCLNTSCSSSDDQQCLKCKDGFKLDEESKDCIACSPGDPILFCNKQRTVGCDRSVCDECRQGYFLDGMLCKECRPLPNCASVKCTSLKSSTCTSCKNLYMFDHSKGECIECPSVKVEIQHCQQQKIHDCFKVTCDKCEEGFVFQDNECKEIEDNEATALGEQKDDRILSEQSSAKIAIFVFSALGGLLCAAVIIFLVLRYCRKPTKAGKTSKITKKEIDISTLENSSNELKQNKQIVPVLNLADVKLVDAAKHNKRKYSKDHSVEELTMKNGSIANSASSKKTTHSKKSHYSSHYQPSETSHRSGRSHPDRFRDPRKYWYGTEGYDNAAFSNGVYGYIPGWQY